MLELKKAPTIRRISAGIVDLILIIVVMVAVILVIKPYCSLDTKEAELEAVYDEYCDEYGIDPELTQEEYDKMTKEEQDAYNAAVQRANEALNNDKYVIELFYAINKLYLFIALAGISIASLIVELVVPLVLGNGQTIGKKIFKLGVRNKHGYKASIVQLLARSLLGKILPAMGIVVLLYLFLVAIWSDAVLALLGIAVLEILVYMLTKRNALIHDVITSTACVDMRESRN